VAALRDMNGFAPLHFAALNGHADVVRYLLAECGVDVEAASGVAAGGLAALGFAVEQHAETSDAARKLAVVRELVAAGARLDVRNARGLTPMARACRTGRDLVAALLVESGADGNLGDEGGRAPLHHACDHDGSTACVRALLGRAETAAGARTNSGLTPLLIASHASRVDCMRALLEDRDADEVDIDAGDDGNDGVSALHIAVRHSDASATLLLLRSGADANISDVSGRVPLHLATDAGVARLLLSFPRIAVNAVDALGRTALHRAALSKQGPLVAALLERADIDVTILDVEGKTAVDYIGPADEQLAAAIMSRLPPSLAAAAAERRERAAKVANKKVRG
jgi:ankyrin repeat protein